MVFVCFSFKIKSNTITCNKIMVKVVDRNPDEHLRETKEDLHKTPLNYVLHSKLKRVFAKPFAGNLDGHHGGVSCLGKHPTQLLILLSEAYDGEVRAWDIPRQSCVQNFVAHEGIVRGICDDFFTIGDDKTIQTLSAIAPDAKNDEEPLNTILNRTVVTGVNHSLRKPTFSTCEVLQLWEESQSDRSIMVYDIKFTGSVKKVVMKLHTNHLAWNPMEAFIFTCANEDYNLYTFDTRNLKKRVNLHVDHTSAVIDINYSPTGREFVSSSYDESIRLFEASKGHSRNVYHTKRIRLLWSLHNKYILSESDEINIRIWKARTSEKLGILKPVKDYIKFSSIERKYANHPQIKRISRRRQVPKHIYNALDELQTIIQRRKEGHILRR